jgi:uncharacterized protein YndB with AHSA1/START domain
VSSDRIEKTIEIKAPVSRVWRALTDHREFGTWFRVRIDGPFVVGEVSRGQVTYSGYEHVRWEAVVQKMEPERLFSFTWHPYAVDPNEDYSKEPPAGGDQASVRAGDCRRGAQRSRGAREPVRDRAAAARGGAHLSRRGVEAMG